MKLLIQTLTRPSKVFQALADPDPKVVAGLMKFPFGLVLLPPLFAYLGAHWFGWRLGAEAPLFLDDTALVTISFAYFVAIAFGLVTTVFLSVWMAATYGARDSLSLHLGLFTVVCAPLALASIAHLFPHVFFNLLVLIPALAWSMLLLYRGLPMVLGIPPERGMLMASSLVAWLLVAFVSLLGIIAWLWTLGVGANMWV